MHQKSKTPLVIVFFLSVLNGYGQIHGLWLVTKVTVGDKVVTPVAKWVDLKEGGAQTSGNGLLQHIKGTWQYDRKSMMLTLTTSNGIDDPFGPFLVNYKKNSMTWERIEEQDKVLVELERTTSLPEGPADKIIGLWDVEQVLKKDVDITQTEPHTKQNIFIRWDRVYVRSSEATGKTFGIWHINGHRPLVELISRDPKIGNEMWEIAFTNTKMIWNGASEGNKDIVITYQRISKFPE